MAYSAYITKLENLHPAPNSERLLVGVCAGDAVVVPRGQFRNKQLVLYLPTDGKIERWFGNALKLFRYNEDGTPQGGYVENNGHICAIRLRENMSSGIVIDLDTLCDALLIGEDEVLKEGPINTLKGRVFVTKYIPSTGGTSGIHLGKTPLIKTPEEFEQHIETKQLWPNIGALRPGDTLYISLKMHGTSQRSGHYLVDPDPPTGVFEKLRTNIRKWRHIPTQKLHSYPMGARRTVPYEVRLDNDGNVVKETNFVSASQSFRIDHHKKLMPLIPIGTEIFYEIVGFQPSGKPIMPSFGNEKIGKSFVKQFGKTTTFFYGCEPGQSSFYVYRIKDENGEWTPEQIIEWCAKNFINCTPPIAIVEYTTPEALHEIIDSYLADLPDPIGKTHVKEGVVVRVCNRLRFTAFKAKTDEFKIGEGIAKEKADVPDMEEAAEAET